jgi:biotin synthase-related radical SAM superfamily protein
MPHEGENLKNVTVMLFALLIVHLKKILDQFEHPLHLYRKVYIMKFRYTNFWTLL